MWSAIFVEIVFNAVFVIILLLLLLLRLVILLLLPIIVLLLIIVCGLNLLLLLLLLSCNRFVVFDFSFHEFFVEAFFLYDRGLFNGSGKGLLLLLLLLILLLLLLLRLLIRLLIHLIASQRHPHSFMFNGHFIKLVAQCGCTRDSCSANHSARHFHRLSSATFFRLWISCPVGLWLQVSELFDVVFIGRLCVLNSVLFSLFSMVRIICIHLDRLTTLPIGQLSLYRLDYRRHVLLPLRPVAFNITNDVFRLNLRILQESEGCFCCSCEWIPIGGDTPFFSAWF